MFNIMSMFKSATPAPAAPAAPANANVNPAGPNPVAGLPNANNQELPNTPDAPGSNVDNFDDLWKTDGSENQSETMDLGSVDPKVFSEAAAKANFLQNVDPTLYAKLKAGGEEAVEATAQLINLANQRSFAHTSQVAARIAQLSNKQIMSQVEKLVADKLRQSSIVSERARSEQANSPGFSPLIDAVEQQFAAKHPSATPQQISQMVRNYFRDAAAALDFNPTKPTAKQSNEDEDSFFDIP